MVSGIHLYVSICNLTSIAEKAETHGDIPKVFFSMDLLLSELDTWTKSNCPSNVYIEKLTGSRIHFVINTNSAVSDGRYFWDIVNYSYGLLKELNDASKLASLSDDYQMKMGADYGLYVNSPISHKGVEEENTIGDPANQAAKIQQSAESGCLYISGALYSYLGMGNKGISFNLIPQGIFESLRRKYPNIVVYKFLLSETGVLLTDSKSFFSKNRNPFDGFLTKLSDEKLSQYSPVTINGSYHFVKTANSPKYIKSGYVLYCDIRGSTKLVAAYELSLSFPLLVQAIMKKIESMIDDVFDNGLDHVQVQGDRESAMVVVADRKESTARKLMGCAFALQGSDFKDLFESHSINADRFPLSVGVGISYGSFYRSSIGTRADSENLLLGSVVNEADDAEDKGASKPNVIALTIEAYRAITSCGDSDLRYVIEHAFKLNENQTYYVSVVGKSGYMSLIENRNLENNANVATGRGDRPWAP